MKKILLWVIAGILLTGIITGIVLWNKPHATVDNKKGIAVSAEALADSFIQNEEAANSTYLNQVVEVNGVIAEVSRNQEGKNVLLLESSDPLSGVQCTMRDTGRNFETGTEVRIKGFCNGFTTVVLLSECIAAE